MTRSFTFEPDLEELFQRAREIEFWGRETKAIPPETMLLIRCVHGTHDGWLRLNALCDIAEHIHALPEMDWGQTFQLADKFGSQRMLRLGMLLVNDVLGVIFQEPVLEFIHSDPAASSLAHQVSRKFLLGDGQSNLLSPRWLEFQARERV